MPAGRAYHANFHVSFNLCNLHILQPCGAQPRRAVLPLVIVSLKIFFFIRTTLHNLFFYTGRKECACAVLPVLILVGQIVDFQTLLLIIIPAVHQIFHKLIQLFS